MRSHGWLSASLIRPPLATTDRPLRQGTINTPETGLARLAIAFAITSVSLSLMLVSVAMAAPPALAVWLDAEVWESGQSRWATLDDDQQVVPGDRILYTVRLENSGDEAAAGPAAIGPIPVGTLLAKGTATESDEVTVEYSLDGGRTFSPDPTLTVVDPDGTTRTIPAPIDQYTTLRWTWDAPLFPGATRTVSYQVRVR